MPALASPTLWIDWLILAAYLAAVLGVGFLAASKRREGMEDYVLAGRSLTLPMFVASLVTTFYGGVLGVGEFTWTNGLVNWLAMGAPYYLFGAVYAVFLAGRIRVSEGMTIPDHLHSAYGKPLAVLAAFLLFFMMNPADDILMLGTILQWATGYPLAACMVVSTGVALAYVFKGGLRADVWTNNVQFVFMFGGFFLILPFAYLKLGGWSWLSAHLPPAHLSPTGGKSLGYLLSWYLIAVWTLVDPTFHQRACAAKDPATARNGILISILFWCAFDFMTTTAGLYARALIPNLANPMMAYPLLSERLLPPVIRGLFLSGMISSMIASLDGGVLVSAVALAKDGLGRWFEAPETTQERWVTWAVPLAGALGMAMAFWLPSVVEQWYVVGSTVNPALLLPLLSIYFPALRVRPWAAFASSACGFGLSAAWFAWGHAHPPTPLGIEPMYPGLIGAAAIWTAGLLLGARGPTAAAS